jgi:hypothetical protein
MLDKIFGWGRKKETIEAVPASYVFGRYSDNNKTVQKTRKWAESDQLFKEGKILESLAAFLDYLNDDAVQNVSFSVENKVLEFTLFQGSKQIRGSCDGIRFTAETDLALMPQPSVPVMRKLLEQNFHLYYCRFALINEKLCMRFDSEAQSANPNKLYYALKELTIKSDKLDDWLLLDFSALQPLETGSITPLSDTEKEVKFRFLQQWIRETLEQIEPLDVEKMGGGIAHVLLNLIYRIDYLLVPEKKLLLDIEDMVSRFFTEDEKPVTEKNKALINALRKLADTKKETVIECLFRSKFTFSVAAPQPHKVTADTIYASNQNMLWYKDNQLPHIAQQISEYGLGYCQYNYSLPAPVTELYHILMRVRYSDFFDALGYRDQLYQTEAQQFNQPFIELAINSVSQKWKNKYPQLAFPVEQLRYENLMLFTHSFTAAVESLNTESIEQ